jgi:hypothetical protein
VVVTVVQVVLLHQMLALLLDQAVVVVQAVTQEPAAQVEIMAPTAELPTLLQVLVVQVVVDLDTL